MILFYYCWFTGFSGQSLFEDYVYSGSVGTYTCICIYVHLAEPRVSTHLPYTPIRTPPKRPPPHRAPFHILTHTNTSFNFFLAMPIICIGFFDQDLSEKTMARFRWAYVSGRENLDLNLPNMGLWLLQVRCCLHFFCAALLPLPWFDKAHVFFVADPPPCLLPIHSPLQSILDSIVLFFLCFGAVSTPKQVLSPHGTSDDLYVLGTLTYSAMLLAMLYKAGTNTHTWTAVSWFFFLGSLLLYLLFLFAYGALLSYAGGFYHAPYQMLGQPSFWLLMLLVPTVSVVLDYAFIYVRLAFFPTPVDVAMEVDRGLHPPGAADDAEAPAAPSKAAPAPAPVPAERLSLKQHGADGGDDEEAAAGVAAAGTGEASKQGGGGGWYPGKLLINLDLLRRLNAMTSAREREAMGINDASAGGRMASSFDYTGTATTELGPGAIGEGHVGPVRLPTPSSAVFMQREGGGDGGPGRGGGGGAFAEEGQEGEAEGEEGK